ncbi:MAG: hypothetical protein LQ352_007605 [Teloschistes flavicans]|nr:MAG: hypothetical protein LQ352_007605 [Teloschistes flavicans]
MEPPCKRRRLLNPNDPDAELDQKRTRNTLKLKSRFESIFEKYGKDFGDAADEIDMKTGAIVVDNGHIWNMLGETDVSHGGQDNGRLPSGSEQQSSLEDSIEESSENIIPDSQDYESDDDEDPLTTLTTAFRNTASQLRHNMTHSTSQSESIRRHYQQPNKMWFSSPSGQKSTPSTFARPTPRPRLGGAVSIEEAWRAPPLPGDDDPQLGLPSPQPSDFDDDGASRSASPPGISLWALPGTRCRAQPNAQEALKTTPRNNVSRASSAMWTQEEDDSLRHFKNSTPLKYNEICDHFPGRSDEALQRRWEILCGKRESAPESSRPNRWTVEEETFLRHSRLFTPKSWREIQAEIPGRSIRALQFHWHKLQQQEKSRQSSSQAGQPLIDSAELLTPVMPSQTGASDSQFSSRTTELLRPSHPLNAAACPTISDVVDSESVVLGAIESDEMLSRDLSPVQKKYPPDVVIPDSQSLFGTQQSAEQLPAMPSSPRDGTQQAEPGPTASTTVHDSQRTPVHEASNLSENRHTCQTHQSELAPVVQERSTALDETSLSIQVHAMHEVVDLTLDDDEDDGSGHVGSNELPSQHATSVSLGDRTRPVSSERLSAAATETEESDRGKQVMVSVPATSQLFKRIEIRKSSSTGPEIPMVKSLDPRRSMEPPGSTPKSPRLTLLTPIKNMTPSSTRAKVIRVTPLTPQQRSERIAPFTLVLPNSDGVPIERGKLLFPRVIQPPRPATVSSAVEFDIAPLLSDDSSSRKEAQSHMPSSKPMLESQNHVANLEDDEDDLQVLTKAAPANHPWNTRGHSYDSLRPRTQDTDTSDDELSLPVRPVLQRLEMTPVPALQMTDRRLTSRF